jgi:catechol 2,3-dioxygenase-like lactoylglutathione lyase family enzyme
MPTVAQVAQHADDLDRAADFYTNLLGGELLARFEPPGLVFVNFGRTRILLERAAPRALLYLGVPDVLDETERLRSAGVIIETEPHLIFADDAGTFGAVGEQEWMAFVRDSEGNLVGLVSRRKAA